MWVDFKTIRSSVSIEQVLDHYGLKLRRVNQKTLRGNCPLPTHSSNSENSFSVDTAKNVWSCHGETCRSARNGKNGGNQLDLVRWMEACDLRTAGEKMYEWFLTKPVKPEAKPEPNLDPAPASNAPLAFALKGIDPAHPYLTERGVLRETAEEFGIGVFSGKGSMAGRCVFPIGNEKGELVAYAGRSLNGEEPRYKFPAGFHKSFVLWNYHRAMGAKHVVVVEGFFDCIVVSQSGYPCVALMGNSLSDEQEMLLRFWSHIVLMLDGDDAGKEATREIAPRLARNSFIRIVSVDRQPDELSPDEIHSLLDPTLLF